MCDLFEYSVVQHKTTLWTLILCLLTMLLFGIWQFLQIFRELSQQLTLLEVRNSVSMNEPTYLIDSIVTNKFQLLCTLLILQYYIIILNKSFNIYTRMWAGYRVYGDGIPRVPDLLSDRSRIPDPPQLS